MVCRAFQANRREGHERGGYGRGGDVGMICQIVAMCSKVLFRHVGRSRITKLPSSHTSVYTREFVGNTYAAMRATTGRKNSITAPIPKQTFSSACKKLEPENIYDTMLTGLKELRPWCASVLPQLRIGLIFPVLWKYAGTFSNMPSRRCRPIKIF